jgi:hypothetical protein
MEAEVSSVEARSDLGVDARVENEGNGWAGSGANPWHLDQNTESILFLTNESNQPARIGFQVTANGIHYYLTQLKLQPHETRAINIRQLRDAQLADFRKNKIPAAATDGSVTWIRLDNVPVMGRLLVIARHAGMSSSYDCCTCPCPAPLYAMYMTAPEGCDFLPGQSMQCDCYAYYHTCNENSFPSLATEVATWSSSNTSVIITDSSVKGEVHAVGVGTADIKASLSGQTSTQQGPPPGHCVFSPVTKTAQMPATTDSLIFTITSGGVPNDGQGVISRQPFGLEIQAELPGGVGVDTNFNVQGVPFTLGGENTQVGESAPSSVNFSSGIANASVTIVQAGGLEQSKRKISVSADTANTDFYPYVYMNAFATDEGLVNAVTACNYKIPTNAQMVALPYGQALCGQQVHVANGPNQQTVPVEDVGPWCPNTPGPGNSNTCSCSADAYWTGTGIPKAVTLEGSCNSNGAGIDLGDGTYSSVRGGTNGPVDWKFP